MSPNDDIVTLWSMKDVQRRFGVSRSTVEPWVKNDPRFPRPFRVGGKDGSLRWDPAVFQSRRFRRQP